MLHSFFHINVSLLSNPSTIRSSSNPFDPRNTMNSGGAAPSSLIDIGDERTESLTKNSTPPPPAAAKDIPPPPAPVPPRRFLLSNFFRRGGKAPRRWKRGLAILDFFLRLLAIAALVAAAVSMGTDDETLHFVAFNYRFYASSADFPALTFFVIADAIAGGYLVFSIPFSITCIIRPLLTCPRLFLLTFDLLAVALTTAAGSAAAVVVYLARTGNSKANWIAFCMRFQGFCQQSSRAVLASFVGTAIIVLTVILSALALRRR